MTTTATATANAANGATGISPISGDHPSSPRCQYDCLGSHAYSLGLVSMKLLFAASYKKPIPQIISVTSIATHPSGGVKSSESTTIVLITTFWLSMIAQIILEPEYLGYHLPFDSRGIVNESHVVVLAASRRCRWQGKICRPCEDCIPRERLHVRGLKPEHQLLTICCGSGRGIDRQGSSRLRVSLSCHVRCVGIERDRCSVCQGNDARSIHGSRGTGRTCDSRCRASRTGWSSHSRRGTSRTSRTCRTASTSRTCRTCWACRPDRASRSSRSCRTSRTISTSRAGRTGWTRWAS